MKSDILTGIIDMHIHAAPDVRPRRLTDLQLMEEAVKVGARAVVIKSHLVPTVDRATLVNEVYQNRGGDPNQFTMFGGITLNASVGGINPKAVEATLKLGGKVIWLPSSSATNHYRKHDQPGGVETVVDGRVVPALKSIFQLVKDYDAVLATAHLSPEEILVVVEAARTAGVKKIVVTHPEFWVVGLSLEQQFQLVKDYDVLLERCYAQPLGGGKYQKNLADNVTTVKEIGAQNIVVSTDGGQLENPVWPEALAEYISYLADHGVTQEEIAVMTRKNPAQLLGLSEEEMK